MRKLNFLLVIVLGFFTCPPLVAQWTSLTLPLGRWNTGVTNVGTKVLFAGGFLYGSPLPLDYSSDRVDIYDTATNQWTSATLSQARHSISAVSAGNLALFAGGQNKISTMESSFSTQVDIYWADTGKWTTANLAEPRANMATAVVGGKVLFAGGDIFYYFPSNTVDIYDIATNQWSVTKLPEAIAGSIATTSVGSTVVFTNPTLGWGRFHLYNVSTGQWTTKANPQGRQNQVMTSAGNKILFAGGINNDGTPSNQLAIYDLITDQWTTAQLSQARSDISVINASNIAFFAGGSGASNAVDIYNATTNQMTIARLAEGRAGMATTVAGNKVFFAGSNTGSSVIDIYDLVTNQWSASRLPTATIKQTAKAVNDKALFIENFGYSYAKNNTSKIDIYTTNTGSGTFLDISTNSINIPATATSGTSFSITANTSWSVSSTQSWLIPSSTTGSGNQEITLTAANNTSTSSRTAVITVLSPGLADRIIRITQDGATPTLTTSTQNLLLFTNSANPSSITITANVSWSVTSSQSWASTSPSSGTGTQVLSLSVTPNPSTTSRIAILTISGNGVSPKSVTVTQAGTPSTLAVSIVSPVGASGGITSVTVTSNTSWSATSSQPWLVASPSSGTGTMPLTISTSANTLVESRTATVTITAEGIPNQAIIVVQTGIIILGTPSTLEETVTIYPNPVSDRIYIRGLPSKSTILIYDIIGNLQQQQSNTGPIHTIMTDILCPGFYYLRIQNDRQTLSKQFLKIQ